MLYENACTYQIERCISFCQNPGLNRRMDKTLNLDKVSRYSNYNRNFEHANIWRYDIFSIGLQR